MVVTLVLALALLGQTEDDVRSWLGRYADGVDEIAFEWNEGLVYRHGNITIPVDGEWHITVPEFYVRHRVRWLLERRVLVLEESHDDSEPWVYELRLMADGERVAKVSPSEGTGGSELTVKTYHRVKR